MSTYARGSASLTPLSLGSLRSKTITVLTDCLIYAFGALREEELTRRMQAKARMRAELDRLDLFGLTVNRTDHEEYQPGAVGGE